MRQLTAMDRFFLTQETRRAPMHISMLAFYTQPVQQRRALRFRDVVNAFAACAPKVPILHEKILEVPLGIDNPYWIEDEELNVEAHLHHMALPKPGDWRQLCILVARLHARALDRSRALWEACVIEGLDNIDFLPSNSFAILFKQHHAAVDGAAALHTIRSLHSPKPAAVKPAAPLRNVGEARHEQRELMALAALHALRSPLRWGRLLAELPPAIGRFGSGLREKRFSTRLPRVHTRFNGRISAYRVVESVLLELEEVNSLRAAVPGSTLNDVVVSVVGGALRSYLAARGELPESSLMTVAPLSFRDSGDAAPAGNQVSAMAFAVHTDIDDPLERLRAVHRDSRSAKEMTRAIGPRMGPELMDALPRKLAAVAYIPLGGRYVSDAQVAMPANTVVTNVSGPRSTLYLGHARMIAIAGLGPLMNGMGLFHAVQSYDGTLTIAVNSCREMMPDPAFYAECLRSAYRELLVAAGKSDRSGRGGGRRQNAPLPRAGKVRRAGRGARPR